MATELALVKLRWAGVYLDGAPATGTVEVRYDGGPVSDEELTFFPSIVSLPIAETSIIFDDGDAARTVGYAEVEVPASNTDGTGGTYTVTERLHRGGGRTFSFPVDAASEPTGMWISALAGTDPTPGAPIVAVYPADFVALADRVGVLEADSSGGGNVVEYVTTVLATHVEDTTPHPAYDDLPSLRLIFENGLV